MDLINSHLEPQGKILNALDFPYPSGPKPPRSIASDLAAWAITPRVQDHPNPQHPSQFCWAIAGTAGAFSTFHVDSDGLATFIDCVSQGGSKYWILVGPEAGGDFSVFADAEIMYAFHFGDGLDTSMFGNTRVEAVLLTPGTRLYVNPSLHGIYLMPLVKIYAAQHASCGGHTYLHHLLRFSLHINVQPPIHLLRLFHHIHSLYFTNQHGAHLGNPTCIQEIHRVLSIYLHASRCALPLPLTLLCR